MKKTKKSTTEARESTQKAAARAEKSAIEAPTKVPHQGWKKALYAFLLCLWVFVVVVGVQLILALPLIMTMPDFYESTLGNSLFSVVAYIISIALLVWGTPKILKIFKRRSSVASREQLGLKGLPTWTDIGLGVVGYVASILIAMLLTLPFQLMPWFDMDEAQDLGYSLYMSGIDRAIAFVAVAVIAPIAEEIVFRGWLYGKLRISVPKWVAILLTSLLFGLVHLQWNVGISVFAMSLVACSLREVTGTIYAGTLVHVINNSVAFILVYVIGTA